jgi:hypothetical protein
VPDIDGAIGVREIGFMLAYALLDKGKEAEELSTGINGFVSPLWMDCFHYMTGNFDVRTARIR